MIRDALVLARKLPARTLGREILLLSLLVGSAALAPASEIFKWVDEDGKVHYGDRPSGSGAQEMNVESSPTPSAAPTDAERRVKQQRLLDAFARERAEKKATAEKEKQARLKHARDCARARDRLRRYEEATYLYDYDSEGNKVVLSKERRAEATARYTKAVKKHCGPG